MKHCPKCDKTLDESFFGKDSTRRDGLQAYCIDCCRKGNRDSYNKHRESRLEHMAEYRRENYEEYRAKARACQKRNSKKKVERDRIWRSKNPEKARQYELNYRNKDPLRYKAVVSAKVENRRSRKLLAGGKFSKNEFLELCKKYGSKCLACGRSDVRLTADHVIPLTRSGNNYISNIQPLCRSCNSKKHDRIIDYRAVWDSRERDLFGDFGAYA